MHAAALAIGLKKCSGCGKSLLLTEFLDPRSSNLHTFFRTCGKCRLKKDEGKRKRKRSSVPPKAPPMWTPTATRFANNTPTEALFANNTPTGSVLGEWTPTEALLKKLNITPREMHVKVPAGASGTVLHVQAPDGSTIAVAVPAAAPAGSVLEVTVPGPAVKPGDGPLDTPVRTLFGEWMPTGTLLNNVAADTLLNAATALPTLPWPEPSYVI